MHCELNFCLKTESTNPPVLYCCVHLEIEALEENIGRWETTWFNVRILGLGSGSYGACFDLKFFPHF